MKTKNASPVRQLVPAALFLALAFVLPLLTGQVPKVGNMLCPMHFPVLLCGFVLGGPWGLAVGFIAPLVRSVLFGKGCTGPPGARHPAGFCRRHQLPGAGRLRSRRGQAYQVGPDLARHPIPNGFSR